jgi:Tfp pilus assembly protein PilF
MNRSLSRRERAQLCYEAGSAHLAKAEFDPAKTEFEKAIALNPQLAEAHLGLSTSIRNLGTWPEAERSARAALEINPQYAKAAHYLGALLVEQDRLSEALPFLQAAVEWEPNVAQHQRDLGVTQLFLGDIDGSRARLLRCIELDVHTHEVLYTLIRMWKMDDGSEGAAQLLAIVRELEEKSADLPVAERSQVLFALGKAHEDRGEFAEAAKAFARANSVKRGSLD